ncbi:MAG: succinylglutamate desuccinylase/aspartoacylase family protein [Rhodovarius sp.]|nr:succinylglutamate desuccinylase/aspartoacylase family protein [Rhodovarius sp.]
MSARLDEALAALAEGAERPRLPVALQAPDLRPWAEGNAGRGVWSFAAPAPGPHLCVVALTHGNEIAGAILLERWLRQGLRPLAGRLTLVFANLDAYARFDAEDPIASRFLEQDLNRVWNPETLAGEGRSCEARRARALRPVVEAADVVLDLHSILWPSDPLMLVAGDAPSRRLALSLGEPPLVVSDPGHEAGRRLIDHVARRGQRAILLEAGHHWEAETVARMERVALRLMAQLGLHDRAPPLPAGPRPRHARVVRTVTARSDDFRFARPIRGGEVIAEAGTLIAWDGAEPILTPHPQCLIVMPTLRTQAGQTAVRLAAFEA